MTQRSDDWSNKWAAIVAEAWADDSFKKRLLTDPAQVLRERGLQTPAGVRFKIVEDTDQVIHLNLPEKPSSDELVDDELRRLAGGIAHHGIKAE